MRHHLPEAHMLLGIIFSLSRANNLALLHLAEGLRDFRAEGNSGILKDEALVPKPVVAIRGHHAVPRKARQQRSGRMPEAIPTARSRWRT